MKNSSKKVSNIIREIKKYAKRIVDAKHEQDLKDAFWIFD